MLVTDRSMCPVNVFEQLCGVIHHQCQQCASLGTGCFVHGVDSMYSIHTSTVLMELPSLIVLLAALARL